MIRAVLPLPPSQNNLFVDRRDGKGRAKSSAYSAWRREAGWIVNTVGATTLPPETPYQISIEVRCGRNRDIGNLEKAVTDLLVWLKLVPDDRWLDRIEIMRVGKGSSLTVTAGPIDAG